MAHAIVERTRFDAVVMDGVGAIHHVDVEDGVDDLAFGDADGRRRERPVAAVHAAHSGRAAAGGAGIEKTPDVDILAVVHGDLAVHEHAAFEGSVRGDLARRGRVGRIDETGIAHAVTGAAMIHCSFPYSKTISVMLPNR